MIGKSAHLLTTVTVVLAFLECIQHTVAVPYHGACSTDAQCTDDNAHTECQNYLSSSCTKGRCECHFAYEWDSSASKCKLKRYYLDSCVSSNHVCQPTTSCIGGQCRCAAGSTFNPTLGACVSDSTDKTHIGQNCNQLSECNIYDAVASSVECVVPSSSTSTQKKCLCKAGYREFEGTCKLPIQGQPCLVSVGCTAPTDSQTVPSTDSSLTAPTCNSATSRCECGSGNLEVPNLTIFGYRYNSCLSTYSGTQNLLDQACTASNQCASKFCAQCPGITLPKCLVGPTI